MTSTTRSISVSLEPYMGEGPTDNVVALKLVGRPAAAFGKLPKESLADGLETDLDEIRSAVSAIPPSAISAEEDWVRFARALAHEARLYQKHREQLWDTLDAASRTAPRYDEAENRDRWERYIKEALDREKPITIATVFDLAIKNGWSGLSPSNDVSAVTPGPPIDPNTFKVSFSAIPHRQWLYGVELVRGDISVMASAGGLGKTTRALGMAIAVATGKDLLEEKLWGADLRSLYLNVEDGGLEMQRRIWAFGLAYGISEQDLDRLYVAGTDHPNVKGLSFLRTDGKSSGLDNAGFRQFENLLAAVQPDLVVLDPLIALCGGANVNDNAAMALAMRELKRLAIAYRCAVLVIHHTRKGGEASAEAISGASSIVNLARCARMPVTMTDEEADKFVVPRSDRLRYFKVVDAKSNLAPRSAQAPWYELCGVELPNAEPPIFQNGDHVQVIKRVHWPSSNSASKSPEQHKLERAILDLIDRGKPIDGKYHPYSPSLAGAENARALLDDAMQVVRNATAPREWGDDDLKAFTKHKIKEMKTNGLLVQRDITKGQFRGGRGLAIGEPTTKPATTVTDTAANRDQDEQDDGTEQ